MQANAWKHPKSAGFRAVRAPAAQSSDAKNANGMIVSILVSTLRRSPLRAACEPAAPIPDTMFCEYRQTGKKRANHGIQAPDFPIVKNDNTVFPAQEIRRSFS